MRQSSWLISAAFMVVGCSSPPKKFHPGNDPPSAGSPPAAPSDGIQLASPQFTLQPGDEIFKCWYTSLPNAADIAVARFESWMTPGSHHFIVYTTDQPQRPDGTVDDCGNGGGGGGIASAPVWLYAAQDPHGELDTPAGVAMPIKAHQPMFLNMHYINSTTAPVTVQVWLNFDFATGSYQKAGSFVTFNTMISIPGGGQQTVAGNCDLPAGAQFFIMSTHSHKHTVDALAARYAHGQVGEQLVKTTDWEHASIAHFGAPGFLTFAPGEQLHYECSYRNDTAQTITVGQSAITNEMCMAVGYYFPSTGTSFCLNSARL